MMCRRGKETVVRCAVSPPAKVLGGVKSKESEKKSKERTGRKMTNILSPARKRAADFRSRFTCLRLTLQGKKN